MSDVRADLLMAAKHRDANPKDDAAQANYAQALKRFNAQPQISPAYAPSRPAAASQDPPGAAVARKVSPGYNALNSALGDK